MLINLADHDGDLTGPVLGQVLALPHGTSSLWHLTPVTSLLCQPPRQLGSHPGSVSMSYLTSPKLTCLAVRFPESTQRAVQK